jgi:hypothetical protein
MTELPNSIASYVLTGMNETDFLEHLAGQESMSASDRRPLSTYDRNGRYRVLAYLNEVNASLGISTLRDAGKAAIQLYRGELYTVVHDAGEIEIGEEDPKAARALKELLAGEDVIAAWSHIDSILERLKAAKSAAVVCVCLNKMWSIATRTDKLNLGVDHRLLHNAFNLEGMSWAVEIPKGLPDFVVAMHRDGNAILYYRDDEPLDRGPWSYASWGN